MCCAVLCTGFSVLCAHPGEEDPEQFKARLAITAAMQSADYAQMQEALDQAQQFEGLKHAGEGLATRLQEVRALPLRRTSSHRRRNPPRQIGRCVACR